MEGKQTQEAMQSILVVEDSPVQAEQLRSTLVENGFAVTVAKNGDEALAAARDEPPELVISDVMMPGMDGYELCRRLKDDPRTDDVPVMLLTALSDPGDILRGLECGADNFLTKPCDPPQLLSRIGYMLLNRRIRSGSSTSTMGLEVHFHGTRHTLSPERMQVLDLLLSSFEAAVEMNRRLTEANRELQQTLERVRELEGLLPVCCNCGEVRNDRGAWQKIEDYVREHGMRFTHGLCPRCIGELYPELDDGADSEGG